MPILDVTRNRHLESDGQEIRVLNKGMIFFHIFLAAFLIHIWLTFPGHRKCV